MIVNKFELIITTVPDRERPVVEIFFKDYQWAEISQETNQLLVQFYFYPEKQMWEFTYEEVIEVLYSAKTFLALSTDSQNKKFSKP